MTGRLNIALHAVSVRRGSEWALREVSLSLTAGERWALVGGNGAGKTQLLKVLATEVWPTPTGRERRQYRIGRRSIDLIAAKRRVAYVGAELQDKYARYGWSPSIRDLLATGLHRSDLLLTPATTHERRRIDAMLRLCGLMRLADRRFLTLSYGQKRLALLARALVQSPDWLLLDEFYNGLDGVFRRRIDRILARAVRRGQSWIAAAHRAADVPLGSQWLLELHAGRVRAITRLRRADLVRMSLQAGERRSAAAARAAEPKGPNLRSGRTLVRVTGADLYVEHRPVLRNVNWELRQGEHWAVFGANGAGKSSFLRLLYGDLSPAQGGRIERSGYPAGTPIAAWKRCVGYVAPELQTEYAVDVTILDLVASGRHASIGLCEPKTPLDLSHARHWLRYFALTSLARRRPQELSYGQLRRALFARALAAEPRLVLLDEPLTGLDPGQRAAFRGLLRQLMNRGRTLIIAVHHPEDLPPGMTHALYLHNGRARCAQL